MERQYESMGKNILENDVKIQELNLNVIKLQQERSDLIQAFQVAISEIITNLDAQFEAWHDAYVVTSPIEGKLHYSFGLKNKSNLQQGFVIGFISPQKNNSISINALWSYGKCG